MDLVFRCLRVTLSFHFFSLFKTKIENLLQLFGRYQPSCRSFGGYQPSCRLILLTHTHTHTLWHRSIYTQTSVTWKHPPWVPSSNARAGTTLWPKLNCFLHLPLVLEKLKHSYPNPFPSSSHEHTCWYTHKHTLTSTFTQTHKHPHTYRFTPHTHSYTHSHSHTHTHTHHIHTHIHTHTPLNFKSQTHLCPNSLSSSIYTI